MKANWGRVKLCFMAGLVALLARPSHAAALKPRRSANAPGLAVLSREDFPQALDPRAASKDPSVLECLRLQQAKIAELKSRGVEVPPGMVVVPAGLFYRPEPHPKVKLKLDWQNGHRVWLPTYFIDRYEVTWRQWDKFVQWVKEHPNDRSWWPAEAPADTPVKVAERWRTGQWRREWGVPDNTIQMPDHPVVGATGYQRLLFAAWAGKRLPTEDEWTKACRGIDRRLYPWGDVFQPAYLNTKTKDQKDGFITTSPVGHYPQGISPWGCYDMAGNMWEMTSSRILRSLPDGRVRTYYNQRGGAFWHPWHELNYWGGEPYSQGKGYRGFRLVMDVPEEVRETPPVGVERGDCRPDLRDYPPWP